MRFFGVHGFLFLCIAACSSTPQATVQKPPPDWVRQPTRTVDAGYIVYIGRSDDASPERAIFKAEALAVGDLINECSFAPKGARLEDRYDETVDGVHHVWAKIGLTFEECEGARNTIDPEAIRKMANLPMAETWKKYQDLFYTADSTPDEVAALKNNDDDDLDENEGSGAYAGGGGVFVVAHDTPDYFVLRQQVAYAKQQIIFAPPGVYPVQYVTQLRPAVAQIHHFETLNPSLAGTHLGWSAVQHQPGISFPSGFAHHSPSVRPVYPSSHFGGGGHFGGGFGYPRSNASHPMAIPRFSPAPRFQGRGGFHGGGRRR